MKSDFSIGDRVQMSALGASRCPRHADKTGTIVGRSIYVNCARVLLDGNKSPISVRGAPHCKFFSGRQVKHLELANTDRRAGKLAIISLGQRRRYRYTATAWSPRRSILEPRIAETDR